MRLLLLASIALLPGAAAPAGDPASPQPEGTAGPLRTGDMPVMDPTTAPGLECPPISRYHALRRGGALKGRKLTELPDADHYKAAYRRIDGCIAPIVADFGVRDRR